MADVANVSASSGKPGRGIGDGASGRWHEVPDEGLFQRLADGEADLVAFGVPFLSNPDLPARLRHGALLNEPQQATFYGGGAKGYTDYPTLGAAQAAE